MLQEFERFEMNILQQNVANVLLVAIFSDVTQLPGFIRETFSVFLLANGCYNIQGTRELGTVTKILSLQPIQNILNPKT